MKRRTLRERADEAAKKYIKSVEGVGYWTALHVEVGYFNGYEAGYRAGQREGKAKAMQACGFGSKP